MTMKATFSKFADVLAQGNPNADIGYTISPDRAYGFTLDGRVVSYKPKPRESLDEIKFRLTAALAMLEETA